MSKTNWKKYAMGIVTASTALLLAACGGGDDTDTTDTPDTGNDTTESGDTAGDLGGELQVSVGPDYISFITEKAAEFEAETGVSVEVIERDTDRDNFMSAEEALEYGLIDKVLYNR